MKMNNKAAAALGAMAALTGNNLLMSGDGENVTVHHFGKAGATREDRLEILNNARQVRIAKQLRRQQRFDKGRKK